MSEHTMLRPLKIRVRPLDKINSSDESGFALIFVLILSVALITMLTFAVTSSVGNLGNAANFSNSSQAQNSAMTGLSDAIDQMTAPMMTVANLPCSVGSSASPISMQLPQVRNSNDTYWVAIAYSPAGTGPSCNGGNGSIAPTSAQLLSTGTTAGTTPVVMQENVTIAATQTSFLGPFNDAIFGTIVTLTNQLTVNRSPSGLPGDVYGGTLPACQNSSIIDGDVQVGSVTTLLALGNHCEITGNLYVNGSVTLNNNATVDGSIYAYGGSVTLNQQSHVGHNIYAKSIAGVGGNITLGASASIGSLLVPGNLYATGLASDLLGSLLNLFGQLFSNYSPSMIPAAPTAPTFPQLTPTALSLSLTAGDTATPTPHDYTVNCIGGTNQSGCHTFDPTCSDFAVAAAITQTTPTAIYAPTCVVNFPTGTNTISLGNANTTWVVGGLNNGGNLNITSTSVVAFSVIVSFGAACPAGDLSFNGTNLSINLKLLFYTPCDISYGGNQTIQGQIISGGTISSTGQLTLTFDQQAAGLVPGTRGSPNPSTTVTGKTVKSG
jgi:hypothetical protein